MKILISACLLGHPVRYDGQSKEVPDLMTRLAGHEIFVHCPEVAGGLKVPRSPAEMQKRPTDILFLEEGIVNKEGGDVTKAYLKGAQECLALCQREGIEVALLKEKSPSCGSNLIYDGSHQGKVIPGMGITAHLLNEAGISLFSEDRLDAFYEKINSLARRSLIQRLAEDPVNNAMALYFLKHLDYDCEIIGQSLILYKDPVEMIVVMPQAGDEEGTIGFLKNYLKEATSPFFIVTSDLLHQAIRDQLGMESRLEVYPSLIPDDLALPEVDVPGLEIKNLQEENLAYVKANYHDVGESYLKERLAAGMLGAFLDGKLVGFMGTHDEGSMGLLFVDPDHRGQGIAKALEVELTKRLRQAGLPTFGEIEVHNERSLEMHRKAGYLISPDIHYWFWK